MFQKNAFRVQQTQDKTKPKKTKPLVWKLFKGLVKIVYCIYRVWQFFEGDN